MNNSKGEVTLTALVAWVDAETLMVQSPGAF